MAEMSHKSTFSTPNTSEILFHKTQSHLFGKHFLFPHRDLISFFVAGWVRIAGLSDPAAGKDIAASGELCTSPSCVRAAARLLARLDPSVDPCEDFYQFSCGRFLETYSVPDDSNQLSTLQEMQDEMLLSTKSSRPFDFFLFFFLNLHFCVAGVLEQPLDAKDEASGGSIRKVKDFYASCMSSRKSAPFFLSVLVVKGIDFFLS